MSNNILDLIEGHERMKNSKTQQELADATTNYAVQVVKAGTDSIKADFERTMRGLAYWLTAMMVAVASIVVAILI